MRRTLYLAMCAKELLRDAIGNPSASPLALLRFFTDRTMTELPPTTCIYRACDPVETVGPNDPRWVDLATARGNFGVVSNRTLFATC
jgi:hypothetical protein